MNTFLSIFSKSCRRSIIQMVCNSQSGHPGGSLSSLDFLSLLYTKILGKTGEKLVVSNGHISPAVYSVLAEMGYISKEEVVKTFRKFGSKFEGHVTRHVDGIWFGTGPLGSGISAAAGFAVAEKRKSFDSYQEQKKMNHVFCVVGDGECQEGQVYETLLFAAKEKLNNFVVFVDWNEVQLTDSLEKVMPTDLPQIFGACGWNVLEIDGHNFEEISEAIENAEMQTEKPTVILGKTIMGHGVEFMEKSGREKKSDWHGKAPKKEDVEKSLENELFLTEDEEKLLQNFREKEVVWHPKKAEFPKMLSASTSLINRGTPRVYNATEMTDCRTAYGMALLDLAKENKNILALTADLRSSVMTKFVASELPNQHIEMGIAEQNMVSVSGGLSFSGYVPFCSTFGAFMSSRAKDQARVNDINECNVKMVATHCGLSVGEDGPTHQAIDDMGSFLGMFNTHICEPADPNHCDRLIRYAASVWGNFYIRMGRHKIPVLTKENGEIFFDESYECVYGKCDVYREGSGITIIATGATVCEAEKARKNFKNPEKVEIVIASSVKWFDETLEKSLRKNKKIITVEDHNIYSGLFSGVSQFVQKMEIPIEKMVPLGATHYQLSGTPEQLYSAGKIDAEAILEALKTL